MFNKHHRVCGPAERGRRDENRSDFSSGFGPGGRFGFGPMGAGGPMGPQGPMGDRAPCGPGMPFGPGAQMGQGLFGPGGPMGHGPFGRGQFGRGRARRGEVRTAILQLLAEEPRNGYQIISALNERSGGAWRPSPGAVYPALSQLEDEGLIEAFDNEGSRAFRLTKQGLETPEVHADTAKIWEEWDGDGANRVNTATMWRSFGEMSMALKAVMMSGSPELVAKAEVILAETKRALYGLLASEPKDETQASE